MDAAAYGSSGWQLWAELVKNFQKFFFYQNELKNNMSFYYFFLLKVGHILNRKFYN